MEQRCECEHKKKEEDKNLNISVREPLKIPPFLFQQTSFTYVKKNAKVKGVLFKLNAR